MIDMKILRNDNCYLFKPENLMISFWYGQKEVRIDVGEKILVSVPNEKDSEKCKAIASLNRFLDAIAETGDFEPHEYGDFPRQITGSAGNDWEEEPSTVQQIIKDIPLFID